MEILEFVKSADVDPIYFEASYYMAPDDAGEKPYALLFEALKQTGYCALAKIAMHNREHVVFLRPSAKGIQMHTMYYKDEIRMVDEFRTDTSLVKPAELAMAKTLVETLAAEFEPEKYSDAYRENLKGMIQAKIEGKQTVEPPQEAHLAPVIDIMEALKMSLENAKKPVRTATGKAATTEEAAPAKPKKAKKA